MSKIKKISFRVTDIENTKIRAAAKEKKLSLSAFILNEIETKPEQRDAKQQMMPEDIILIIDEINRLEKKNPKQNFKPLQKAVRRLWQR